MPKITFLGAGSTIFAKNILGDILLSEPLCNSHIALYDIDKKRLSESRLMIETLNENINGGKARITAHLGTDGRKESIENADYIINAIQVGGYKPSTVIDFEIPKKYGLKQTIGDTLGIGGIFRALRTIPVLFDIAREIEAYAPDAWLLNYTNPMAMITGAMLRGTKIRTVGLCHSVQKCAEDLLSDLDMSKNISDLHWTIAGINHMAWLLKISDGKKDLYPEIKLKAAKKNENAIKNSEKHKDMVRYEMMKYFGYYITESSEHNAEYSPYWIKNSFPELIDQYNIPIDEYLHRCEKQISEWETQKNQIIDNKKLTHTRTHEYGSYIIEAMETDQPYRINGNVLNKGFITNLPHDSCVEIACLVDKNGIHGTWHGELPPQCAAMNMTNINVQELTIQAALSMKKEYIYQAAFMDPHTSSELTLEKIKNMCDELIDAHGSILPEYK